MSWRLSVVAAALFAAPLRADEPTQPAWAGVWQGTIGALPVQACLQQSGGGWSFGAYYYRSQNKIIRLTHEPSGAWTEHPGWEDKTTGAWQISANGAQLSGTWQQGAKQLPIALSRVALTADDAAQPCGSRAFIAPRLRPVGMTRKPARNAGIAYTQIDYHVAPWFSEVSITSFAIAPTMPGDAAINRQLLFDPNKADSPADYVWCMSQQLGSTGSDGDFSVGIEPFALTEHFLTAKSYSDQSCGGPHPNSDHSWGIFDRTTGKLLDLARWFSVKGKSKTPFSATEAGFSQLQITPALRRAVMRRMKLEPDCREGISSNDYWYLGLTSKGMVFAPALPRVAMACGEDVVVPFADLAPFLSPYGKANLARLGLRPMGR